MLKCFGVTNFDSLRVERFKQATKEKLRGVRCPEHHQQPRLHFTGTSPARGHYFHERLLRNADGSGQRADGIDAHRHPDSQAGLGSCENPADAITENFFGG